MFFVFSEVIDSRVAIITTECERQNTLFPSKRNIVLMIRLMNSILQRGSTVRFGTTPNHAWPRRLLIQKWQIIYSSDIICFLLPGEGVIRSLASRDISAPVECVRHWTSSSPIFCSEDTLRRPIICDKTNCQVKLVDRFCSEGDVSRIIGTESWFLFVNYVWN